MAATFVELGDATSRNLAYLQGEGVGVSYGGKRSAEPWNRLPCRLVWSAQAADRWAFRPFTTTERPSQHGSVERLPMAKRQSRRPIFWKLGGGIGVSFKRQEYASERNEVVPIWYLKIWTEAARGESWNHKALLYNN